MKKILILSLLIASFFLISCNKSKTKTATDANGYKYEYVSDDPTGARIYTLENGLKIYLAVNKNEPKVQTFIAVKAGAKNDPAETTGLAHYFEHMMFKGTSKIGTTDWEKESALIQQISDLFELRAKTNDPAEKERLYAQIDSLSVEASKYAVANEYDKICSMIGAQGTNAWTSTEETVYVNEIPSNEMERFLYVERERFENIVLRLFHTELETVYEEFNMGQDRDGTKAYYALQAELFKKHPYGRKVIGIGEHLKNPSMVNIMKFKSQYYVPNNIAICMSGDLDMEATVKLIDKYWGSMKPNKDIPKLDSEKYKEEPRTEITKLDVLGPDREWVTIGWRTPGNSGDDESYLDIIGEILNNGTAGLIDLDLVKSQKVMSAYAGANVMNDYGCFMMGGYPKEGQSLEEVQELLLQELDKVKKGEFDEWLIQASVNQQKLNRIRAIDNNSVAYWFVNNFISGKSWEDEIFAIEKMEKLTKQQIVDYANKTFIDNYAVVYKRTGKDTTVVQVEKPKISDIIINREAKSEFVKGLEKMQPEDIAPAFIDYKALIKTEKISEGVEYDYIKNEANELFELNYIVEIGRNNDQILPIAVDYIDLLGTDSLSVEDLAKEWYKKGIEFYVSTSSDKVYVQISGLDENLEEGIKLMENVIANVKANQNVYNEYVNDILKNRFEGKKNKNAITGCMQNYSKYGKINPSTDILSSEMLKSLNPDDLTSMVKNLFSYKHKIFYYGPREMADAKNIIVANHKVQKELKEIPAEKIYPELDYQSPKVLFVNYDMVQTIIYLLSKDVKFDKTILADSKLFNEYYGGSMGSIVFQTIREAKGLAYSSYAGYQNAGRLDRSNYVLGFLSTQPDKIKEAMEALYGLLDSMPLSQPSFEISKNAVLKNYNTERIIKSNIFWNWLYYQKLGIDYDIRKDIYNEVSKADISNVDKFFNNHIKDKKYDVLIIGDKSKIDFNILKKYGEVKELSLEEIFGY